MEDQGNLFAVPARLDHVSISITKERLLEGEPIHLLATGSGHKRTGCAWHVECAYHTDAEALWIPQHVREILQGGWTTYGLREPRLTSLERLVSTVPPWEGF